MGWHRPDPLSEVVSVDDLGDLAISIARGDCTAAGEVLDRIVRDDPVAVDRVAIARASRSARAPEAS